MSAQAASAIPGSINQTRSYYVRNGNMNYGRDFHFDDNMKKLTILTSKHEEDHIEETATEIETIIPKSKKRMKRNVEFTMLNEENYLEEYDAKVEPLVSSEEEVATVIEVTHKANGKLTTSNCGADCKKSPNEIIILDLNKCKIKHGQINSNVKDILGAPWEKIRKEIVNSTWKIDQTTKSSDNLTVTLIKDRSTFEEFALLKDQYSVKNKDSLVMECFSEETLEPNSTKNSAAFNDILEGLKMFGVTNSSDILKAVITKKSVVTMEEYDDEDYDINNEVL